MQAVDGPLLDPPDPRGLIGDFRAAMRRVATSVAVVTGAHQGQRGGLTATAVCPVCIDPPSLLVSINRSSNTHELIARSRRFAVNILAEDHRDVAETFAGRTGHDGEAKFAGAGVWEAGSADLPILSGAVAFIACRIIREVEVDTHTIFVGLVERAASRLDGSPLVYFDRRFASLSQ